MLRVFAVGACSASNPVRELVRVVLGLLGVEATCSPITLCLSHFFVRFRVEGDFLSPADSWVLVVLL